ncbi:MAG TPA: type II toxin-antitoxin system VapC family toxin [Actinomycetota bacterium]|nr:type II toxin-antitoxin system VapC family toxin [Actinomycetota bacterium]
MNAYFDTSAIVKLVVAEEASEVADAAWDTSDLVATTRLTYAEARAALAAARRSGRLTPAALDESKNELERRFEGLDLIEVTGGVVRSAGDLADRHGLRGYDAVHLASALAAGASDFVLVTWDRELTRAGRTEGMAISGVG